MWADSASAEGLLLAILLLCPQVIRGMEECSRVFSIRTLVPCTSQSPYFLIPARWRWGLQDVDLERHKHSVYCRCCDKLPFSKECPAESYESHCTAQLFLLNAAFLKRAEKREQDEKHREKKMEKNRKIYGSLSLAWDSEWCSVSTLPSLPPCHTHTHTHTQTHTCTHTHTHILHLSCRSTRRKPLKVRDAPISLDSTGGTQVGSCHLLSTCLMASVLGLLSSSYTSIVELTVPID